MLSKPIIEALTMVVGHRQINSDIITSHYIFYFIFYKVDAPFLFNNNKKKTVNVLNCYKIRIVT